MKKHIIIAAILTALLLPTHALAEGMPVIDIQQHLDWLTSSQIYKDILNLQSSASKIQNDIMRNIQNITGIDRTVQASQDAVIATIDANTPRITQDIQKKMDEIDHNVSVYKSPDEQAADIIKIKKKQIELDKQCRDHKELILKAKTDNAKAKAKLLTDLNGKDNLELQKHEAEIEAFKAKDDAYAAELEQVKTECEDMAKLLDKDLEVSAKAITMTYDQEMDKSQKDHISAMDNAAKLPKNISADEENAILYGKSNMNAKK